MNSMESSQYINNYLGYKMNSYMNNFNNNANNNFNPNIMVDSNGFSYNTFSGVFPFMNNPQIPDYSVMNTIPLINNNQYRNNELLNMQESTIL